MVEGSRLAFASSAAFSCCSARNKKSWRCLENKRKSKLHLQLTSVPNARDMPLLCSTGVLSLRILEVCNYFYCNILQKHNQNTSRSSRESSIQLQSTGRQWLTKAHLFTSVDVLLRLVRTLRPHSSASVRWSWTALRAPGTPPDANALVPAVVLHSLPAVCRPGNCSNTGEQSGGSRSLPASSELVVTTLPTLSRFEVGWRRWRKSPVATIIWPDIPFGYLT